MEIRELFQKFYPNTDIKVMELCPCYDSRQSFYGKARGNLRQHNTGDQLASVRPRLLPDGRGALLHRSPGGLYRR